MGNVYKSVLAGGTTPTPITPSDSSPASMTAGTAYEPTTNGYAIENQPATLTPNNTTPPSIASDTIYKGGGTGKAIASIATNGNGVAPSTSGQYFASGWNRMTTPGYAYSEQPKQCKVGSATISTTGTTTITLGFQPKYICYRVATSSTSTDVGVLYVYDERYSTTKQLLSSAAAYLQAETISGNTGNNRMSSITSTGFVVNKATNSSRTHLDYFAIG